MSTPIQDILQKPQVDGCMENHSIDQELDQLVTMIVQLAWQNQASYTLL